MPKKIYKVTGTVQVEVYKWVKADSEDDAMDIVSNMSIRLEDYMNDTVGVDGDNEATGISEAGSGDCIDWKEVEVDEDHDYDMSTDRYGHEIWLEGNMIHDSGEDEFEDDQEAYEEACDWIEDYIEENPEYEFEDFDIKEIEK